MEKRLGSKTIVLLGIGHTHAHLVKQWAMTPLPDVNMVCVTDQWQATYSGMLPGVLAGDYAPAQMEIDLVPLFSAAQVSWIHDQVTRVDRQRRRLYFASGRTLGYDLLSVGVGSRPPALEVRPGVDGQPPLPVVSIKPMQSFLERLTSAAQTVATTPRSAGSDLVQIDVVGGGLGSVEIVLCLPYFLAQLGWTREHYRLRLISGAESPPVGCLASTRRKILAHFNRVGIELAGGAKLAAVEGRELVLGDGRRWSSDWVLFLGAGQASPVTACFDLPRDARGCLLTDRNLQSIGDPHIWAGGDCGTIQGLDLPKAGVYAVRQGPVMWDNLRRWSQGQSLQPYRPQSDFLKLINLGGGQALGEYRGWSFQGRWVWRWKDRIDTRFMAMYQTLAQQLSGPGSGARMRGADASPAGSVAAIAPMRCLGCGSKLGADLLRRVLRELSHDFAAQGSPIDWQQLQDDVAMVPLGAAIVGGEPSDRSKTCGLAISVDAFPTPLADPWLSGRLAAIHALSDLWASGVVPQQVLATVEIPFGAVKAQEEQLRQVMAGVLEELRRVGVRLIGGHSLEGPRLSIALTVMGQTLGVGVPAAKQGWRRGDRILVTKGLGTGAALAALHQGRCSANTFAATLESMLQSNGVALDLLARFPVTALTDVTGFGLLGHLHEMTAADQCLSLSAAAVEGLALPGVPELLVQGVRSTMHENNACFLAGVTRGPASAGHCEAGAPLSSDDGLAALLLDPQTSGGLLLGVPSDQAAACVDWLVAQGYRQTTAIGVVQERDPSSDIWCQLQ